MLAAKGKERNREVGLGGGTWSDGREAAESMAEWSGVRWTAWEGRWWGRRKAERELGKGEGVRVKE
jgi:hypothetical protein